MSQIAPGGSDQPVKKMNKEIKKKILGHFLISTPIAMVIAGILATGTECSGYGVGFGGFLKITFFLVALYGMFIAGYNLLGFNSRY